MIARSVVLITLAATLAATLTAAGALAADPPAPPEKQRLICRGGGGRSLGSHIRTSRRCRTAEQWQEEDEAKSRAPISLQVTQGQNDGRQGAAPR